MHFSGVVLVAKNGHVVFAHAYGRGNRLDTRFNLASLGKTFTAVAVASIVQEGKLHFGDRIGRYVPQFRRSHITVAELLDHTSGLGDYFASPDYDRLQPTLTSLDRYLPLITRMPLVARPGSGFHYSNSGYILLGLIVQRVSGVSYYTFLQREVFRRAGMTRSGCFFKNRLPPDTAIGRTLGGGTNTAGLPPRGTSAGGCYSTVHDLLAFSDAMFSHRLLNASLTATITSPKVVVGPEQKYGYGFGIRDGTIWHNGGSPGVGTELDVNRKLGYTVVMLSNLDYPTVQPAIDLILERLRIP